MSTGPQDPHTTRHIGKYELRERLGRGGMAEVWKAYDPQLQRFVAIKFLHTDLRADPDFMTRFVREAQAVAALHHPNIVLVHDFFIPPPAQTEQGTHQGHPYHDTADDPIRDRMVGVPLAGTLLPAYAYMVMNYVEGPTLAEYIRNTSRSGKFPSVKDIVHLFTGISSAIDYAHRRGMVHRDIKPANIILDIRQTARNPIGEPILTDFGIVKLLGAGTSTLSSGFIGTPNYASPEQARGEAGDERSDLYSLGVILYEIWTGARPFQGDNPYTIAMQHINAQPVAPTLVNPRIPPAISEVIFHSLTKDPQQRFPSASAMTTALIQAINSSMFSHLSSLGYSLEELNNPTYPSSLRPNTPPNAPSSSPSLPIVRSAMPSTPVLPTPSSITPVSGGYNTPTSSPGATSGRDKSGGHDKSGPYGQISPQPITGANVPAAAPPGELATVHVPPGKQAARRQRRELLIPLIALLILVVAGSGVGAFYLFSHQAGGGVSNRAPTGQVGGSAIFVSTGQVSVNDTRGIADQLQLSLQSIPTPASGASYYAWLLSDDAVQPQTFISLGKLTLDHGKINLLYPGDAQHTNLLCTYSRLLVTEESGQPAAPPADQHAWRYFAQLPQTPEPIEHKSALQNIRSLLCNPSYGELQSRGIQLIADPQFLNNVHQVSQWASQARAAWDGQDAATIKNQAIRILDYIDGKDQVAHDVPVGTPLLADPTLAQVPLFEITQKQVGGRSYILVIDGALNSMLNPPIPGITPLMTRLATQAIADLTNIQAMWLGQVRTDARRLVQMSNTQLLAASTITLLHDMQTQADYAYNGQVNPSTHRLQGGALEVDDDIQHLATFQIAPWAR